LHIRREPLDGGKQTRAKRRQDRTSLGRFPIRFCFSCWQRTATIARRRDHHSQRPRLLGVIISSDRETDKHVSHTSSACVYWLRQIRRIRRSLDTESAKAFVSSRLDCCNAVLAGSSKATTDRLQRVLNAAARVANGTQSSTVA